VTRRIRANPRLNAVTRDKPRGSFRVVRATSYLWAGAGSLLGLIAILAARVGTKPSLRRNAGTLEAHGGALATVLGWLGAGRLRIEAIALGHVILARDAASLDRYRDHERVHVRQWVRWGPLFVVAYPLASLWAWLRGRDPYRDNRFEREAWRSSRSADRPPTESAQQRFHLVHDAVHLADRGSERR
jgi:hypothetical protein